MAKRTERGARHRRKPVPEALRVGERVRRLRMDRGFNFDAFVEEVALGRGYVSELERGLVVPSLLALGRIAEALETSVADLVIGDTPRDRLYHLVRGLTEDQLLQVAGRALEVMAGQRALPFRVVSGTPSQRFVTAVPLLTFRDAQNLYTEPQQPTMETWVEPIRGGPVRKGQFVARVFGSSAPKLVDATYCLFERPWSSPTPGVTGIFVAGGKEDFGRFVIKVAPPRKPVGMRPPPPKDERPFAKLVRPLR